jgi:hypothetical protein
MDRKLAELSLEEFKKMPRLSKCICIGKEKIYAHFKNAKKMDWYLAEYDLVNKRFYGYQAGGSDGISSGVFDLEDLLKYSKKGQKWELIVDDGWKPAFAEDIPQLQGYIGVMRTLPDG